MCNLKCSCIVSFLVFNLQNAIISVVLLCFFWSKLLAAFNYCIE